MIANMSRQSQSTPNQMLTPSAGSQDASHQPSHQASHQGSHQGSHPGSMAAPRPDRIDFSSLMSGYKDPHNQSSVISSSSSSSHPLGAPPNSAPPLSSNPSSVAPQPQQSATSQQSQSQYQQQQQQATQSAPQLSMPARKKSSSFLGEIPEFMVPSPAPISMDGAKFDAASGHSGHIPTSSDLHSREPVSAPTLSSPAMRLDSDSNSNIILPQQHQLQQNATALRNERQLALDSYPRQGSFAVKDSRSGESIVLDGFVNFRTGGPGGPAGDRFSPIDFHEFMANSKPPEQPVFRVLTDAFRSADSNANMSSMNTSIAMDPPERQDLLASNGSVLGLETNGSINQNLMAGNSIPAMPMMMGIGQPTGSSGPPSMVGVDPTGMSMNMNMGMGVGMYPVDGMMDPAAAEELSAGYENEILALETEINDVYHEKMLAEDEAMRLQEDRQNLQRRVVDLEAQLSAANERSEASKKNLWIMKARYDELEKSLFDEGQGSMKPADVRLQTELAQARTRITELEATNSSLQRDIGKLEMEHARNATSDLLMEKLRESQKFESELRMKLQVSEMRCMDLERDLQSMKDMASKSEGAHKDAFKSLNKALAESKVHEEELNKLRETSAQMLYELEVKNDRYIGEIEKLKADRLALQAEIAKADESQDRIKALVNERDQLLADSRRNENILSDLQMRENALTLYVSELENQVRDLGQIPVNSDTSADGTMVTSVETEPGAEPVSAAVNRGSILAAVLSRSGSNAPRASLDRSLSGTAARTLAETRDVAGDEAPAPDGGPQEFFFDVARKVLGLAAIGAVVFFVHQSVKGDDGNLLGAFGGRPKAKEEDAMVETKPHGPKISFPNWRKGRVHL